jgi:hypothetical protein
MTETQETEIRRQAQILADRYQRPIYVRVVTAEIDWSYQLHAPALRVLGVRHDGVQFDLPRDRESRSIAGVKLSERGLKAHG